MAVVRCEFDLLEAEAVLEALGRPERGTSAFRAHRHLKRQLEYARERDEVDKANMRRMRRNRRVPDFDEEPLIPHSMQRGRHREVGADARPADST